MLLRHLRQRLLLPEAEQVINQRASVRGLDVLLLSFTVEAGQNSLWLICRAAPAPLPGVGPEWGFGTRREKLLQDIARCNLPHLQLDALEIAGQRITFSHSTSRSLAAVDNEAYAPLQHFAEQGLLPAEWDGTPLENLTIVRYQQTEGESLPRPEPASELPVRLHVAREFREIPIQQPFTAEFGQQPPGTRVGYRDPVSGQESYFFIAELSSYDPYRATIQGLSRIADPRERKKARKHLLRAIQRVCPQGQHLAVIRYETPDGVQLRFLLQDYLDAPPEHSNTASAIGFISSNQEFGANGYRQRECVLQPVDRDCRGQLRLELFSRVEEIPAEVVTCQPRLPR
ncbi:MAG: hypothetical protein ACOX18_09450 [Bacillota bacterium]|jgi:hypothetical protein